MLQLIVNNIYLDLASDTQIELQFENPLCVADRIPIDHSLSFEIPNTRKNLIVLSNPNRMTAVVDFANKLSAEIRFASYVLTTGYVTIETVEKEVISLHYVGAIFPDNIQKHLQNQNFGRKVLGTAEITSTNSSTTINTSQIQASWSATLKTEALKQAPDFVAATMKVKDADYIAPPDPGRDIYTNMNAMFINSYKNGYQFSYTNPNYSPGLGSGTEGSGCGKEFAKIILSFRVGWILKTILAEKLKSDTVFDHDLKKLMLICTYHPLYNTSALSPVWDINKTTREVSVSFADYMPDIATVDFITEILKMTCASLYIKGSQYEISLNKDLLNAPCELDWSRKVVDHPTFSRQPGDDYIVGYNGSESTDATPTSFITVTTIKNMLIRMKIYATTAPVSEETTSVFFYVTSTCQYFEAYLDAQLTDDIKRVFAFKLLSTDLGGSSASENSRESSFDMTIQGGVVNSVVALQMLSNPEYTPSFAEGFCTLPYYYCPEIEKADKRGDELIFGLYHGLQNISPLNAASAQLSYPCISNCGVAPDGTTSGPVSLAWKGNNGLLATYHAEYKSWIERDKRTAKVELLLSPMDIHQLDLRKKVHIQGVDFFIKTLNISFTTTTVEPAEVELIEA